MGRGKLTHRDPYVDRLTHAERMTKGSPMKSVKGCPRPTGVVAVASCQSTPPEPGPSKQQESKSTASSPTQSAPAGSLEWAPPPVPKPAAPPASVAVAPDDPSAGHF